MHERQLNSDSPRVRWVGVALSQEVASGDPAALRRALLLLAKHWMEKGEASIRARDGVSMSDVSGPTPLGSPKRTAEQRAFLAAGCDLYDLVTSSAEGRKALADLGLQPLSQQRETE